jgi:hypothetical protein
LSVDYCIEHVSLWSPAGSGGSGVSRSSSRKTSPTRHPHTTNVTPSHSRRSSERRKYSQIPTQQQIHQQYLKSELLNWHNNTSSSSTNNNRARGNLHLEFEENNETFDNFENNQDQQEDQGEEDEEDNWQYQSQQQKYPYHHPYHQRRLSHAYLPVIPSSIGQQHSFIGPPTAIQLPLDKSVLAATGEMLTHQSRSLPTGPPIPGARLNRTFSISSQGHVETAARKVSLHLFYQSIDFTYLDYDFSLCLYIAF